MDVLVRRPLAPSSGGPCPFVQPSLFAVFAVLSGVSGRPRPNRRLHVPLNERPTQIRSETLEMKEPGRGERSKTETRREEGPCVPEPRPGPWDPGTLGPWAAGPLGGGRVDGGLWRPKDVGNGDGLEGKAGEICQEEALRL